MSSNLKEDTKISGGIGLRKQGWDLRKFTSIIIDLEVFTTMSKSKASFAFLLRMLIGLFMNFLKQVSTINFYLLGRLLLICKAVTHN